ncbi:hypothetical protein [Rubidibacter lacunae]|uniref:hypothetical protein n=1 Tax=Rubidibacter lacunae TaxID=582514 RepID=UPI00040F68CC|nr:hypothetical protein [Rubidibacter lacunae]
MLKPSERIHPGLSTVAVFSTDGCEADRGILHLNLKRLQVVTKEKGKTNDIERLNCTLRRSSLRFMRRSFAFQKYLFGRIGVLWNFNYQ